MKEPLKPSKEILQLLKFIKDLGIEYHIVKNAPFQTNSSARIPPKGPLTDIKAWKIFLCLEDRHRPQIRYKNRQLWFLYALAHELGHVLTPLYFNDSVGILCGYNNRLGWYGAPRILNENMAWSIGRDILTGLFGKEILKHYDETVEWCLGTYLEGLELSPIDQIKYNMP